MSTSKTQKAKAYAVSTLFGSELGRGLTYWQIEEAKRLLVKAYNAGWKSADNRSKANDQAQTRGD